MGRLGEPQDVAQQQKAIAFLLASDQASFITGAILPVRDGGTLHSEGRVLGQRQDARLG
jgi:NAD(P)-dependent dehydrogenase (short-subunit alcohol dehydrogenase family)